PATVILRALGMNTEEILNQFYRIERITFDKGSSKKAVKFFKTIDLEILAGQRAQEDIVDPKSGDIIVKKNRKFTKAVIEKIREAKIERLEIARETVVSRISANDVVDESTGEVVLEANEELTDAKIDMLVDTGVDGVNVIYVDNLTHGPFVRET